MAPSVTYSSILTQMYTPKQHFLWKIAIHNFRNSNFQLVYILYTISIHIIIIFNTNKLSCHTIRTINPAHFHACMQVFANLAVDHADSSNNYTHSQLHSLVTPLQGAQKGAHQQYRQTECAPSQSHLTSVASCTACLQSWS